jgi:trehalose 6-phosphate phosphatase
LARGSGGPLLFADARARRQRRRRHLLRAEPQERPRGAGRDEVLARSQNDDFNGAAGCRDRRVGLGGLVPIAVELDAEVAKWAPRVREFAEEAWTDDLRHLRVRAEDKNVIRAFHWRGAPDEDAAEAAVRDIAQRAEDAGLVTHWGRKVLEIRPPVELNKGRGVRRLVEETPIGAAAYVGDDTTDLDAFEALRGLVDDKHLRYALCVGVRSDETPSALEEQADLLVDGPRGVRALLHALAA